MVNLAPSGDNEKKAMQSSKALLAIGIPAVFFTAILAGRMLWEETFLTIQQGPQMLGFSLAHGPGAILFLAPIVLVIWLLVALFIMLVCLWRKRPLSKWYWSTFIAAVLCIGSLSIPPVFWQCLLIQNFARSSHAAELMVHNAAEGNVRTVREYLEHGVPLSATNYEGSTAAFTAAAGGSVATIKMLAARGADLNAVNSYGDSPLEAAVENGHVSVVNFLKSHGASQLREHRSSGKQPANLLFAGR
jgi:hypothetical protein